MKQILSASLLLLAGCDDHWRPLTPEETRAKVDKCESLHLYPKPLETQGGQLWDIVCLPDIYGDRT